MDTLTLILADDHPVFRKGLRALLKTMPDVKLVGEAKTGREALELALSKMPDVILMDLQMPDGGGLEATRELSKRRPDTRILMITLFEDDDSVFAALRAGAHGYVLKDAEEEEIIRAIRSVGKGEAIFSPAIATRLMDYFAKTQAEIPQDVFPELTDRELEVLSLIARGRSNEEIAEQLVITIKTVRNHVSNIYNKLQVADRAQAAIRARDAGLGEVRE